MISASFLVEKVRLLINEPDADIDLSLLSEDTRSLTDTINGLLYEAVLFVQTNKDYGALNPATHDVDETEIFDNDDGSGYIILPDDFVALVELQMAGWHRPCTKTHPLNSAVATAQFNVNTRGGCCKPVCVEWVTGEGKRALSYYSLPAGTVPVVRKFVYEASFDPAVGLNCDESNPLVWAVVYQCVAMLYNIFEKRDAASAFFSLAMSWYKDNKTK